MKANLTTIPRPKQGITKFVEVKDLVNIFYSVTPSNKNDWDYIGWQRRDLCGCVYEIQEGIMVCVKRCKKHSRPKRKRPFRAKAECVRP